MNKRKPGLTIWLVSGLVVVLTCFILLLISEAELPSRPLSSGIVAIISAVIGVLLTVVVTSILLEKQTASQDELLSKRFESEAKKDEKVKVFEEKLKIYKEFLGKLHEVIEDDKILESEVKELIFQISSLAMHTDARLVNGILEELGSLVEIMGSKTNPDPDKPVSEQEYYQAVAGHILNIVIQLQKELYGEEHREQVDPALFRSLVKTIDDIREDEAKPVEPVQGSLKEILATFDETLEKALRVKCPETEWEFFPESADHLTPRFRMRRKDWPGKTHIGISYDTKEKTFFRVHFDGNAERARELYLEMRRMWGGRFNTYNWYMSTQKFNDFALSTEAYRRCDPELVGYMVDGLVRAAAEMDVYMPLYNLWEKLGARAGAVNTWIYRNTRVVSEFTPEGKRVAIDTEYDKQGQWTAVILGRGPEGDEQAAKIVAAHSGSFELKDESGRPMYKKPVNTADEAAALTVELANIIKS